MLIVDDYGHHPTEIKTTLEAIKESWPDRRHLVVFQPHRYTRTRALFDEFSRAFYQSDILLLLPVYAAGEKQIAEVDGDRLCRAVTTHGHKEAVFVKDKQAAVAYLKKMLRDNDLVLTLGAGDVWQVGEQLLDVLERTTPLTDNER